MKHYIWKIQKKSTTFWDIFFEGGHQIMFSAKISLDINMTDLLKKNEKIFTIERESL